MDYRFMGYERENGSYGIRNYVLVIPLQKDLNMLADMITRQVKGARAFIYQGENGRPKADRELIYRVMTGLGCNPNTHSVLLIAKNDHTGYEELKINKIVEGISKSQKRIEVLYVEKEGGFYAALGTGVRMLKEMAIEASKCRRKEVGLDKLNLSVKCGFSDTTSGISGNPVVGDVFDKIEKNGGRMYFSETTEIIGAEQILAKRCRNEEVAQKLIKAVRETEEKALSIGEDIRKVNPIPQNIEGGISTLEEKSLGAIAKAGTSVIQDVIKYGEQPAGQGLYFMDAWMSVYSLPVGYAAAGSQLMIFQLGGQGLTGQFAPMPAWNPGVVTPIMFVTGNHNAYERTKDGVDFDSSDVYTKNAKISDVGDRLLSKVIDVCSGTKTKVEIMNYTDPIELDFNGPNF